MGRGRFPGLEGGAGEWFQARHLMPDKGLLPLGAQPPTALIRAGEGPQWAGGDPEPSPRVRIVQGRWSEDTWTVLREHGASAADRGVRGEAAIWGALEAAGELRDWPGVGRSLPKASDQVARWVET